MAVEMEDTASYNSRERGDLYCPRRVSPIGVVTGYKAEKKMVSNMWSKRITLIALGYVLFAPANAWSQFGTPLQFQNQSADVEAERTQRWKAGIRVAAATGPCAGIYGTFSIPVDWPEQDVKVVEEDVSDSVRQSQIRNLDGGVRQMVIVVPRLSFGEQAEVTMTFEITRRTKPVPLDTTVYRIPKTMPREVRKLLASSPKIDCRNARVRMKAKEVTAEQDSAWEKVRAIHGWMKENVEHTNDPLKGAVETLKQAKGNHEDLAGLFIALCRASKVPARTVWVPNYCYAEFYLEGEEEGEWFPCEFKEKTVFGTVSQPYMILQKGDNVQVPESKERQRFVGEHLKVKSGRKPTVTFVREVLGIR